MKIIANIKARLFNLRGLGCFYWYSKNQHGVHSPFVYDLVTKCFYDKTQFPEYHDLKEYRNVLLENKKYEIATDIGAGLKIFESNKKQTCQIAKSAEMSLNRAELLFRIVKYFKPNSILEIGTSPGLATVAMNLGNKCSNIISLKECPETAQQCQLQFQNFNSKNVEIMVTEISEYLIQCSLQGSSDFIFLDGKHLQTATLSCFEMLLPTISNDSVWIFDNIHCNRGMETAWQIIKNHPKVTVTIDTFQWGVIFFRAEQEKEHFVIRV